MQIMEERVTAVLSAKKSFEPKFSWQQPCLRPFMVLMQYALHSSLGHSMRYKNHIVSYLTVLSRTHQKSQFWQLCPSYRNVFELMHPNTWVVDVTRVGRFFIILGHRGREQGGRGWAHSQFEASNNLTRGWGGGSQFEATNNLTRGCGSPMCSYMGSGLGIALRKTR